MSDPRLEHFLVDAVSECKESRRRRRSGFIAYWTPQIAVELELLTCNTRALDSLGTAAGQLIYDVDHLVQSAKYAMRVF